MSDAPKPHISSAGSRLRVSATARRVVPTGEQGTTPRRELRGVVERITYQNAGSGYTIARLSPERQGADGGQTEAARGEDRLVTVVGVLADLTPGEAIVAQGWWRNDHRYGWQFQVLDYRTALPATTQGMRRYLGSGLVKGVGPKMAERIVDAFGDATFDVIDTTPQRLTEVPGIGKVRSERIAATWEEQRHIREVMAALQGYGVSTSLAVRIYKHFRDDSARVVSEEPYRLAREVWGIGFKTADKIAQAVGIPPDAPERLQAGLLHAFGQAGDAGHTLLTQGQLTVGAAELLGVEEALLEPAISSLLESGDLVAATHDEAAERLLALAPFARAESSLAGRLRSVAAASQTARVARTFASLDWGAALRWLGERHGINLAPEQEEAVRMALTSPVSILTGGPGTGKTHTLRAILTLLGAKRLRPLLAAPTGRAAKRMTEATGLPAGTLHRTLEIRPGGKPGRNPDNPLPADLVVVDEVSMLDSLLANQLVKAVEPGMHLLLVGDPDQLPSVGAGNVLADLLRSEQFPVTRLTRIFRQGAGSGIAVNARRVNEGELPRFGPGIEDCFFLPVEDPAEAAELITDLVARRLPARYGFRAGDVQVLSPMHRGDAGVGALNERLQQRLNPPQEGVSELRGGGRAYRIGDRVLQLKNDYELEVFNGDLGTVRDIDVTEQELLIVLDDGREVRYPASNLYALTHAYAVSVHKSQGAEFPAVVIPLVTSHAVLLSRTLLYTALTRARRLVVLVGQRKALSLAVRDWRRDPRHTALGDLLTGTLRFSWPRSQAVDEGDIPHLWEGLTGLTADA